MKINNIAELKTRKGASNANVEVLGYYTSGDGGGGSFYWNNTSTETDNGGTIIQVTGVTTGRWKRIYDNEVNVKWFGAKGDGIADDTTFIQKCVDYCVLSGDSFIVFPKGTYLTGVINLAPEKKYSGYGANILAKPLLPNFSRIFDFSTTYRWDSVEDSKMTIVEGFNIDGRSNLQATYTNGEFAQNHSIFIGALTTKKGRLNLICKDLYLKNSTADGIAVISNSNVHIENCNFNECWRSGFSLTGGTSKLTVNNANTYGVSNLSRIDVEIDQAGFNGLYTVEVKITNTYSEHGLDIGFSEQSEIFIDSYTSGITASHNFFAQDSTINIENSVLHIGEKSSINNRFQQCQFVNFNNVKFIGYSTTTNDIYLINNAPSTSTNSVIKFNNCSFKKHSLSNATGQVYGFYYNPQTAIAKNVVIFDNCYFHDSLEFGLFLQQGGNVIEKNGINKAKIGFSLGFSGGYEYKYISENNIYENLNYLVRIYNGNANNELIFQNIFVKQGYNKHQEVGFGLPSLYGKKIIYSTNIPTSATYGLVGDETWLPQINSSNQVKYKCFTTGAGTGAVWNLIS